MSWPTPVPVASSSAAALGKRHRDERGDGPFESYPIPPQKRTRGGEAYGIPTATRHKPVAGIPNTTINCEPKEAGRGAERLATWNPQGIHHQPLLGPSFQQGWAVEPAEEQPPSVEGSVEVDVVQLTDIVGQQEQQRAIDIPSKMSPEHKGLLAASEVDWRKRSIAEIKCRLCPETHLKKWEDFKRHCNSTEKHPLKIVFCGKCGDYFARPDSLKRHLKSPPAECKSVKPRKAEGKREATQTAHEQFIGKLKRFVETGEEIGEPFCDIIKRMFPDSSKKGRAEGKTLKSGLEGR
jgi:hypothetical protein